MYIHVYVNASKFKHVAVRSRLYNHPTTKQHFIERKVLEEVKSLLILIDSSAILHFFSKRKDYTTIFQHTITCSYLNVGCFASRIQSKNNRCFSIDSNSVIRKIADVLTWHRIHVLHVNVVCLRSHDDWILLNLKLKKQKKEKKSWITLKEKQHCALYMQCLEVVAGYHLWHYHLWHA